MQNVEIYINNQLVDYNENSGVTIEFKKVIDDWLNFGGSLSTAASPLANNITIPASARNNAILFNSNNNLSDNLYAQAILNTVQIYLNGHILFTGSGVLVNVEFNEGLAVAYSIAVKSTAQDIFAAMEILLTDLDMGNANSRSSDIDAANAPPVADTSSPVVWPLVNYGGRTVDNNNLQFSRWKNSEGVRPAVRFYKIIEAFALQNGYKIQGELYNNSQFQNALYMFGVGEDWERGDNWQDYKVYARVGTNPIYNNIPDGSLLFFPDTLPPYYDPQNLNFGNSFNASANSTLVIDKSGWYEFEIYIESFNQAENIVFDVVITNSTNSSPVVLFANQPQAKVLRTGLIPFYLPDTPYGLEGDNTQLRIYVKRLSGSGNISIEPNSYYKATMNKRAQLGAPIRIASCLHKRTFKEFLRDGIMRMYGAVLKIDNVLKVLTLETRFVNDLGETFPNYIQNPSKSYYKSYDTPPKVLDIDNEDATTTNEKPFGDNLGLYFTEDSSDGTLKIVNATASFDDLQNSVPLYSTSIELSFTGKEGQNYNNYFTPLINSRYKGFEGIGASPIYSNRLYYPTIIDDAELLSRDNVGYPNGMLPTFKSSPKCATWFGVLNMIGLDGNTNYYNKFDFENANPIYPPDALTYNIPTAFQIVPDYPTYFDLIPNPFNLVYPSLFYTFSPSANGKVLGLLEIYYYKYLATVFNDKIIRVRARLKLIDFWEEDFRTPFLVELSGQTVKCWCIGIENYNPIESEFADYTLVVDFQYLRDYEFSQTSRNFKPLILMFSDLTTVNDGV